MRHADRRLRFETLESRLSLDASSDLVGSLLNAQTDSVRAATQQVAPAVQAEGESLLATRPANLDTNGDGHVSPVDALLVINTLIAHGSGPVNGPDTRPPLAPAAPEALQASGGETVTFDPALLAGGDLDPYGCDPVTITLSSQPTSGTARVNAAGHIEYTAPIGTSEEVTVSYIVTNASGVSTAGSFQVTVLANTPPLAPDLTFTTEAGVPYSISIPKIDLDQNTVTHTILTESEDGTLEAQSDGTFLFTPKPGFVGTVTFTYRAFDGHVTSEGTVTVEVVSGAEGESTIDDDLLDALVAEQLGNNRSARDDVFSEFGAA